MNKNILFYTDVQGGNFSLFNQMTESGYGLRLDNIIKACEWVAEVIKERRPGLVINGGDLFDPIGMLDSDSLSAVSKGISIIHSACQETGSQHIMLIGNHDYGYVSRKVSSIDHFGFLSDIEIVKDITTFNFQGNDFLLIPYINDEQYIQGAFTSAMSKGIKMAFTHLDYRGARFHTKSVSDFGIDPTSVNLTIINGHYHIAQDIGNLICPGSLIQHKYSEFCLERYILEIRPDLTIEKIPNKVSPLLYKTSDLSTLDILPDNSYVWVDYDPRDVSEEDVQEKIARFPRKITTKAINSYTILKAQTRIESRTEIEIFEEYIDKIYSTSLDKSRLRELGIPIVQESIKK